MTHTRSFRGSLELPNFCHLFMLGNGTADRDGSGRDPPRMSEVGTAEFAIAPLPESRG
jgi:hypothetical protein